MACELIGFPVKINNYRRVEMRKFRARLLGVMAVFLLGLTGVVVSPNHALSYAIQVIDYYNPQFGGPHTDPDMALGPPDFSRQGDVTTGMYSLGTFGRIDLALGQPVIDIPGYDFAVWEEEFL
jgi:hypothetical protein